MKSNTLLPSVLSIDQDMLKVQIQISVNDLVKASEAAPARERGRPPKLSQEDARLFRILLKVGTSADDICSTLGIGRASYFRYKQRLAE